MIDKVKNGIANIQPIKDEDMCPSCNLHMLRKGESICQSCRHTEELLFEKIPVRYLNAVPYCKPELLSEENLLFFGNFGTGKTATSFAYIIALLKKKKITSYERETAYSLLSKIKNGFSTGENKKIEKRYRETQLLVIDEFEKIRGSDFDTLQLYDIIRERDEWMRKTIIICNAEDVKGLDKIISAAILDRFKRGLIEFGGESGR